MAYSSKAEPRVKPPRRLVVGGNLEHGRGDVAAPRLGERRAHQPGAGAAPSRGGLYPDRQDLAFVAEVACQDKAAGLAALPRQPTEAAAEPEDARHRVA